jgi:polysaccharide export outer membrane protein
VIRSAYKTLPCLLLLAACWAATARAADPNVADTVSMDWSQVPEYRIVPGDRLAINLGPKPDQETDFVHEVIVRPDGRITVYPVGDVVAAGLTIHEVQKSLVSLLAADLRNPRVTIELVSMASNQVHVFGRVERPGDVPAQPFMTVSQAIAGGGGFSTDAARNSVMLIHREGAHTVRVTVLRMDRFLKGQSLVDPPVSRFDIVYVPRSTVGNVALFTQQVLGSLAVAANTALVGWELFNLDRVFVSRVIKE